MAVGIRQAVEIAQSAFVTQDRRAADPKNTKSSVRLKAEYIVLHDRLLSVYYPPLERTL